MNTNNSAWSHVLRISCFTSRKDPVARPVTITWKQFVSNIFNTRFTAENMEQWDAMTREQRGQIKDVGGFTGGIFADGRRGNKTPVSRSCITLDLDNGCYDPDILIKSLAKKLGCAVCGYSTHSHRTGAPKIRLIIPLLKEMDGHAYEAMTQQLIKDCGLTEYADPTTHQRSRLFYWPSASKDAPVWHREVPGAPFSWNAQLWNGGIPASAAGTAGATAAAAEVGTPHGMSAEATPANTVAPAYSPITRTCHGTSLQDNDPRNRPGIVGEFCREFFPIDKAIDRFLGKIYTPCANGRYAYRDARSEGGLVILDGGLYAYSHHANTDPAGRAGRPFNAWDLVQLHTFGDVPDAFRRMTVLAKKALADSLAETCHAVEVGTCHGTSAEAKPAETPAEATPANTPVSAEAKKFIEDARTAKIRSLLDCKKNGFPHATNKNAQIIMTNDPKLCHGIIYNDFEYCLEATPSLPWFKHTHPDKTGPQRWSDQDFSQLEIYVSNVYDMQGRDVLNNGVWDIALKHRHHPVLDYLQPLEWDGVPRLDTSIIRLLGAADTDANREMTTLFFRGAMARIMEPGCKFDYMPILQGPQGCFKSTFFSTMFDPWFSDSLDITDDKDTRQHLMGVWVLELGELEGLRKTSVEGIKRFISQQVDRYRPPYGRTMEEHQRQCVFVGTTNSDHFLIDEVNRRFYVIKIEPSLRLYDNPLEQMKAEKDQLMAEAYYRYRTEWKDRPLVLSRQTAEVQALSNRDANVNRRDPLRYALNEYLEIPLPVNWAEYSPSARRDYYRYAGWTNIDDDLLEHRTTFSVFEFCYEFWELNSIGDAPKAKGKMCYGHWQKRLTGYLQENGEWKSVGRKWINSLKLQVTRWELEEESETDSPQ